MRQITGWAFAILSFSLGIAIPVDAKEVAAPAVVSVAYIKPDTVPTKTKSVFRHGDTSWLPELALAAGWPAKAIPRLRHIILRESGGCPNRRGGDIVDENCNITGVSTYSHRSDTGLLQINGVNYDPSRNKWALICREMGICTQEPLFDPLTNLKAGYLMYKASGWGPWDPCQWGPEHAKRCKQIKNG